MSSASDRIAATGPLAQGKKWPMTDADLAGALRPTPFIDSDSKTVRDFIATHAGEGTPREKVVRLYYAIRDGIRYDPYTIRLDPVEFRASTCLMTESAFCVPKAIALAAVARAVGIPARLGFADVKNHLSSPRLSALLGTDLFVWHGYTALLVDGRWVKATPAFNIELCEKCAIRPLEFDGTADSIFHAYDKAGHRHMEYVRQIGEFDDMPLEPFSAALLAAYPAFMRHQAQQRTATNASRFEDEVKAK
jgi:transglutaminase-like putative cysteine protease